MISKGWFLISILMLLMAASCHRKATAENSSAEKKSKTSQEIHADVNKEDEKLMKQGATGVSNSVILGKVVRVIPNGKETLKYEFCDEHPCRASIEIVSIIQNGSNYHGQFHAGDQVAMSFEFTMTKTTEMFPELNNEMPGLQAGDYFEAEIFEPEAEAYVVKVYEKK